MRAILGVACAVFILAIVCASALPARAALARPNTTDKRVSAIPQATLLAQPAATLVDPDRQAAAARLVRWKAPGWIVMVLAQILALAYFWRSGGASGWRDRLRRSIRSEFWVRFLFGATLAGIARIVAAIPDFYLYRVGRVMDLSGELSSAWALDWLAGFFGAMLLAGIVAAVVLWIADRTHQWYVYTVLVFVAISLTYAWSAPAFIEPVFNHYAPLATAGRPQIGALVARSGVGDIPIVVEDRSKREQTQDASYDGLWSSRRIVVTDTLVAGSTPQELNWYVALELGHVLHGDLLRRAFLQALILILGAALGVFAADRVGFRRDDDPVSRLALVGAIFGCVFFLAVPAYNVGLRALEAQADAYAASMTTDPSAGVRALVRTADENLESVAPGTFATLFFERSPAIAQRISALSGEDLIVLHAIALALATSASKVSCTSPKAGDAARIAACTKELRTERDPRRSAELYYNRGHAYQLTGRPNAALSDFANAVKRDPELVPAYVAGAEIRLATASRTESARSLADLTRAIALDPTYAAAYRDRGLAYFLIGRYDLAAADDDHFRAAQPLSRYADLWARVARLRAGLPIPQAGPSAGPSWPSPLVDLYAGATTPDQAMASASTAGERCEAAFYIAEWQLGTGKADAGRAGLTSAVGSCPHRFVEYVVARSELARLPALQTP